MITYAILIAFSSLLPTDDTFFISSKLYGYWVVVFNNSEFKALDGQVRVLKFNKCKRRARKERKCEYGWSSLPSNAVSRDYKLFKTAKINWNPSRSSVYWIAKKKNKETNRTVLHMIDKSEISFDVTNRELYIYQNDKLVYKLIKLR